MIQPSQHSYTEFIDRLLECPSEEETAVLIDGRCLLSSGLIDALDSEIAVQKDLAHNGNVKFLQFLSQHLSQLLSFLDAFATTESRQRESLSQSKLTRRIEILKDILSAVMISGSEATVVDSLLQSNAQQLDFQCAQLLSDRLPQALSSLAKEISRDYADNLGSFSNQISYSLFGNRHVNREIAIAGYE